MSLQLTSGSAVEKVSDRRDLAKRRLLVVALVAVVAVVLVVASTAWACSGGGLFPNADMTLTPNNSTCPLTSYPGGCGKDISVTGKGFKNSDGSSVTTVDLYWLDEPYFAAGTGGPGNLGEQLTASTCRTQGVLLKKGVSVAADGTFGPTVVTGPPSNPTSVNGTPRLPAYYGANAVCGVWQHGSHFAGVGNQYTIYP